MSRHRAAFSDAHADSLRQPPLAFSMEWKNVCTNFHGMENRTSNFPWHGKTIVLVFHRMEISLFAKMVVLAPTLELSWGKMRDGFGEPAGLWLARRSVPKLDS